MCIYCKYRICTVRDKGASYHADLSFQFRAGAEKAIKQIAYEDGRAELILSMFNSGKTPEQISDFCGLDLKEVEKVIKSPM